MAVPPEPVRPANVDEIRRQISEQWERWELALTKVPPDLMDAPSLAGGWSVKDTVAHIAAYEDSLVRLLESGAWTGPRVPAELMRQPPVVDDWNEWLLRHHRDRPLDEILQESRVIHATVADLINHLGNERLDQEVVAYGTPQPLWHAIAGETYLHYPSHTDAVEAFASKQDYEDQPL